MTNTKQKSQARMVMGIIGFSSGIVAGYLPNVQNDIATQIIWASVALLGVTELKELINYIKK